MTVFTRRAVSSMIMGTVASTRLARAVEPLSLRLTKDTPIILLPYFVAHELKLWEKNGISVTQVPSTVGMPNLLAVSAGAIDVGMSAEISVAIAALSNAQLRILGSFVRVEAMELVCTKAINSAQDLPGKKIAVLQGSLSQYYLSLLMKKHLISTSAVSIIRLAPPEMMSALTSGSIDGFVWQEPFLANAVAANPERFHRVQERGLIELNGLIVTNEKTLSTARPTLRRALRTLDNAYAYIKEHPVETSRIGAEWSKMNAEISTDAIRRMDLSLTLDVEDLTKKMRDGANWAISEGIARPTSTIPDFRTLFAPDVLIESRQL